MIEGYNMNNFWATRWAGLDEEGNALVYNADWVIFKLSNFSTHPRGLQDSSPGTPLPEPEADIFQHADPASVENCPGGKLSLYKRKPAPHTCPPGRIPTRTFAL